MIKKSKNFLLGILSVIPVFVLVASIVLFGRWVSMGISVYNTHINEFIPILVVQALGMVVTSIAVVLMSMHAAKHTNMDRQQLVIWILLLAFFSIITLPIYWTIYVREDREEKIVIKECLAERDIQDEDKEEDEDEEVEILEKASDEDIKTEDSSVKVEEEKTVSDESEIVSNKKGRKSKLKL